MRKNRRLVKRRGRSTKPGVGKGGRAREEDEGEGVLLQNLQEMDVAGF